MTYLIRYAAAESGFMKSLILRHFAAYDIPNLNSLQIKIRPVLDAAIGSLGINTIIFHYTANVL